MTDLEITPFGTATIGSVIDALRNAEPDAAVMFDFCGAMPAKVASYRGWYDHLAIGWDVEGTSWPEAKDVAALLQEAIGSVFTGYKGGEYRMTADTPLWVDRWGDHSGTGIVAIEFLGESAVVLCTAKVD